MRIDPDIQDDAEQAPDRLLADLARLARAIDARAYPGRAWPVRQRLVLRVWLPPALAAAAAAAAIVLAVVLAWQTDGPAPTGARQHPVVVQVSQEDEEWDVPADITPELADMAQPSLAGQLDMSIPNVSMPPLGGGTFTWNVPVMDLTPKIDIEPDVPAENGQTQSSQRKDEEA